MLTKPPPRLRETARSSRPSPSKSATLTPFGPLLTRYGEPGSSAKPPAGCRTRIDTLLGVPLAVARSGRPSPLRAAVAMLYGSAPTGDGETGSLVNEGAPGRA